MRRSLQLAVVSGVVLLAMAPLGAVAQEAPTVEQRLSSSYPAVPSGWKEACVQGPDTGAPSEQCPVLTYNGYTYWSYSDIHNDVAMSIVAYDAAGEIFKQWDRPGARYIWQITVDATAQTVSFAGQSNAKITLGWSDLFIPAPRPGALSIFGADAQAVNCVFSPECTVVATDSTGDIPMPPSVSGTGVLQTRTFPGATGSKGAGKTAYEYRVDMTGATSQDEVPCVTDLTIDFGALTQLDYAGDGTLYDVFLVAPGGTGTVGLYEATRTGNAVTIVFNQPICAGATPGAGLASDFIGLASSYAPKAVTAKLGWPGMNPLAVDARAPAY
jgi:hypothetical protein